MKTSPRTFICNSLSILLVFLGLLFISYPAYSSSAIQQIEIVNVEWQQFPDISLAVNLLDSRGKPISELQEGGLVIKENDINVPFSYKPSTRGIRVVLVIDEGSGLNNPGVTGATINDEMRYVSQRLINSLDSKDSIEVMFVRGETATVSQSFTGNRDLALAQINNWTYQSSGHYSTGLIGANDAIDQLNLAFTSLEPRLVLFLSPGIQINKIGFYDNNIADKAKSSSIAFYSILFNKDDPALRTISQETGGEYIRFDSLDNLDSYISKINDLHRQYTIQYRSTSNSISERIISITTDPNSAIAAKDSFSFTVLPEPQTPLINSITVNNGDPIRRIPTQNITDMENIPPTETKVVASIVWADGYPPRKLVDNKLVINGEEFHTDIVDAMGNLVYNWDLRGFTTPGTTTVQLQIAVKDELGFETIETKSIVVEVVSSASGNPICDSLGKIPNVGGSLARTCYKLGIGPSQLLNTILAIVSLVLVILLWVNRKTVGKIGHQAANIVTSVVDRITQRHSATRARARLELIAGGKADQRTQFDLHGETPIGRDIEHAELIFDSPTISRSHCIIHLDKATGKWFIEDRDSANGTFLNGNRLEPFVETDLNDNDILELSLVERGGLKFRFVVLDDNPEAPSSRSQRDEDATMEDIDEGQDVRVTHQVKRDHQGQRSEPNRPSKNNRLDPSNPEF